MGYKLGYHILVLPNEVLLYVEGMTGYMISAIKFHEMRTTKPTIQRKVLFIFGISHLKQLFCGLADEIISITGKHNRAQNPFSHRIRNSLYTRHF